MILKHWAPLDGYLETLEYTLGESKTNFGMNFRGNAFGPRGTWSLLNSSRVWIDLLGRLAVYAAGPKSCHVDDSQRQQKQIAPTSPWCVEAHSIQVESQRESAGIPSHSDDILFLDESATPYPTIHPRSPITPTWPSPCCQSRRPVLVPSISSPALRSSQSQGELITSPSSPSSPTPTKPRPRIGNWMVYKRSVSASTKVRRLCLYTPTL